MEGVYPIQSSTGSKPAGVQTNGEARSRSSSSVPYWRAMVYSALKKLSVNGRLR